MAKKKSVKKSVKTKSRPFKAKNSAASKHRLVSFLIGVITLADLQTVVTIVVQLSIAGATIYKLLKSKK
jgi:hypothetical protein